MLAPLGKRIDHQDREPDPAVPRSTSRETFPKLSQNVSEMAQPLAPGNGVIVPSAEEKLGRVSLDANHHQIWANQRLDARFDKARLLEPTDAIGSRAAWSTPRRSSARRPAT